jgi:RNA polymerase sigma factor (sigma-70 family)
MSERTSIHTVDEPRAAGEIDAASRSIESSSRRLGELFAALQSRSGADREQAWAACYAEYRQLVWTRVLFVIRTISWLREPRDVAEDVTSDVFVGLPDAVRHYRDEGKAEQWLKQIAVRTALRARERLTGEWQKRSGEAPSASTPRRQVSFDDEADSIVQYLDEIGNDELLELERRIEAMRTDADPRQQRWAEFIDLYRLGLSFAEIGERMGLTEGTARNWLVAIRKHLAEPPARRGVDG